MSFQSQLKAARQQMGYTQAKIAEELGIAISTYCHYEGGKRLPDVDTLRRISKLLNVSCDTLLETEFSLSEIHITITPQEFQEAVTSIRDSTPIWGKILRNY